MAIRVVLAEDSFIAREGIVRALEGIDEVDLVATCGDLDELRAAIAETAPDLVLTDIRMPPTNTDEGIRVAEELRDSHPEIGVVVLSQHAEPLYATALFDRGSDRRAYLLKEQLRQIYRLGPKAAICLLEEWLQWARRSRLRPFVKLARTITEQRDGIVAAIRHGLSNARVEAINTQIRLIARRAFGFHSPQGLISLAMLKLGGLCPPLPGRVTVT